MGGPAGCGRIDRQRDRADQRGVGREPGDHKLGRERHPGLDGGLQPGPQPVMLKLALRCKRHDRFMLVTDAMPAVGSAASTFVLQGRTIRVVDGICRDENGTLAGTALDMAGAVRNAVSLLGLDVTEAARMASEYPAEFLGLGHELGRIAPGYRANLVLVDDELKVQKTWIEGLASAD